MESRAEWLLGGGRAVHLAFSCSQGQRLQDFGEISIADKEEELNPVLFVPMWCTLDVRLGVCGASPG